MGNAVDIVCWSLGRMGGIYSGGGKGLGVIQSIAKFTTKQLWLFFGEIIQKTSKFATSKYIYIHIYIHIVNGYSDQCVYSG